MMGMPEWDGTSESAQEINRAFNDVLDVLVNAGMWTGDPPYRGKCAAEQVRMLVQRATTGEQLATDILAELATERARAEAAEARALEEEAISYDIAAKAALDAQNWREELTVMRQRLDAAEAQLAAVPDYAAYYAAAWEAFEADSDGPEPLDFAEWMAQRASSQRSE